MDEPFGASRPAVSETGGSKSIFTTGEVAEICNISQQTVIRCFDSGRLKGFRVPGSKFRRIPREALIQFMNANGIPLNRLDNGKRRVLVVDDDPAIVEMLVELLERDGRFEVQTASNGFDAGLRSREFRPDVMVLDFKLPYLNGDAVVRRIREDEALRNVKIILISGEVDRAGVDALMRCGADFFLQKPFGIDQLVQKIAEFAGG